MSIRQPLAVPSRLIFAFALLLVPAAVGWAQPAPLFVDASPQANRPVDRTALRSRDVAIQLAQLQSPAARVAGSTLVLNLFADATFTARLDRVDAAARGFVWVGSIPDVALSAVTLAIEDGTVYGSILTPAATYLVRPSSNGFYTIAEIDQSLFPPEAAPRIPDDLPDGRDAPRGADLQSDDGSVIDVMILYTPAAAAAAGGASAIGALVSNAVSVSNTAYANSGVSQRLRLAYAAQVAYTEAGGSNGNSSDLTNLTSGLGALSGVAALRNAWHADLVTLLTNTPGSSTCGIAWLMTSISTNFAPNGYSVVEQSCAVGNLSYPHELGHNMGLRHDWYVDTGVTPASYAHGYVNAPGRWRTIMSYNDRCAAEGFNCTRIPYWSNPALTYVGAPMGIPAGTKANCPIGSLAGGCDADDHRILNETALTVANFRQGVVSTSSLFVDFGPGYGVWSYSGATGGASWQQLNVLSPSLLTRADLDGNGRTDLVASFSGYGIWVAMNGGVWSQLNPSEATDIKAGDLDGNGRDELVINIPGAGLWIRYDNGSWLQLHTLNVTALAVGNIDSVSAKAEVIMSFAGGGVYVYYNNATWAMLHPVTATNLQLGDLDGNGVSDLIVQFPSYGEWILYNNTSWVQLHPLDAAGFVTGNVDGDAARKSDVIIDFPGAGIWVFKNGSTWTLLHPLDATAMATGDLDGNGMDDIVLAFPGAGIWALKNGTAWSQLHPSTPELLVTGK